MLSSLSIGLIVAIIFAIVALVWRFGVMSKIANLERRRVVRYVAFEKVKAVVAGPDYTHAMRFGDSLTDPYQILPIFVFTKDGVLRYGGKELKATGNFEDFETLVRGCDASLVGSRYVFIPFVKDGFMSFGEQEAVYAPLKSFEEAYQYIHGHSTWWQPGFLGKASEFLVRKQQLRSRFAPNVLLALIGASVITAIITVSPILIAVYNNNTSKGYETSVVSSRDGRMVAEVWETAFNEQPLMYDDAMHANPRVLYRGEVVADPMLMGGGLVSIRARLTGEEGLRFMDARASTALNLRVGDEVFIRTGWVRTGSPAYHLESWVVTPSDVEGLQTANYTVK